MRRTCNIVYRILKDSKEYEPPIQLIEECTKSFREITKTEKLKKERKQQEKLKHQKIKQ